MGTGSQRFTYWSPRILGIALALFLGLFALDVFNEPGGLGRQLTGFAVHLTPTWIVLAVLALAWRWEWIGAVAYPLLAALYFVISGGRQHWSAYALISGPLVLLGVLFWLGWRRRYLRSTL